MPNGSLRRLVSMIEGLLIIVLFVMVRAWLGYMALRSMKTRGRGLGAQHGVVFHDHRGGE